MTEVLKEQAAQEDSLQSLQAELRTIIVQIAQRLGYPRSLGEIYGLLYVSEDPMSMEEIRAELNMSLGSASQGLKTLRTLKAVKTQQVEGVRKDFFVAETNFRHLVSGFLREEIMPELDATRSKIADLESWGKEISEDKAAFFGPRVAQVKNLNGAARRLIPIINQFIRT
ncbi:MAG: GbsR/MarR family transcriptional regulator [Opitutales bacterium]